MREFWNTNFVVGCFSAIAFFSSPHRSCNFGTKCLMCWHRHFNVWNSKPLKLTLLFTCKKMYFTWEYVSVIGPTRNPRVLSRERFNHNQYIWIYCGTFIVPIKYLGVFSRLGVLMRSFLTHWNLKEWYLNSLVQEITAIWTIFMLTSSRTFSNEAL